MSEAFDVLTVGRVGVDFYGEELHAGFVEAQRFHKSIGGSPTNVAVAASRLGRRSAVLTKVGADGLGDYVRHALAHEFGVDTRFVGTHPTLQTPIVVAVMDPPEDPPFVFYRGPVAPDATIEADAEVERAGREAAILWISACALAAEPSRSATDTLLRARGRKRHTILDLDFRASFWTSADEARRVTGDAIAAVTVAVGNRAECEVAVGSSDPETASDALLARGVECAIVKMGADGVLVATQRERRVVPPFRVDVVCGLGAGDAFGGALCHALLAGATPFEAVEVANAAGAIVVSRLQCAEAMPTEHEVRELMEARHERS